MACFVATKKWVAGLKVQDKWRIYRMKRFIMGLLVALSLSFAPQGVSAAKLDGAVMNRNVSFVDVSQVLKAYCSTCADFNGLKADDIARNLFAILRRTSVIGSAKNYLRNCDKSAVETYIIGTWLKNHAFGPLHELLKGDTLFDSDAKKEKQCAARVVFVDAVKILLKNYFKEILPASSSIVDAIEGQSETLCRDLARLTEVGFVRGSTVSSAAAMHAPARLFMEATVGTMQDGRQADHTFTVLRGLEALRIGLARGIETPGDLRNLIRRLYASQEEVRGSEKYPEATGGVGMLLLGDDVVAPTVEPSECAMAVVPSHSDAVYSGVPTVGQQELTWTVVAGLVNNCFCDDEVTEGGSDFSTMAKVDTYMSRLRNLVWTFVVAGGPVLNAIQQDVKRFTSIIVNCAGGQDLLSTDQYLAPQLVKTVEEIKLLLTLTGHENVVRSVGDNNRNAIRLIEAVNRFFGNEAATFVRLVYSAIGLTREATEELTARFGRVSLSLDKSYNEVMHSERFLATGGRAMLAVAHDGNVAMNLKAKAKQYAIRATVAVAATALWCFQESMMAYASNWFSGE